MASRDDSDFVFGTSDSSVEPALVIVGGIATPTFGTQDDFLGARPLEFVGGKCDAEVEQQSERFAWVEASDVFVKGERGFDGVLPTELVAIEDALQGNAVVRELNRGMEPVVFAGGNLAHDASHAVEHGRVVFEADDQVSDDRVFHFARRKVDVGAGVIGTNDDGHIQTKTLVGFADDFVQLVPSYEADFRQVAGEVAGDVAARADFVGELDDGVVFGLPMDFFQTEGGGFENGFALYWRQLPVITDEKDGHAVAFEIVEDLLVDHRGFVNDDAIDGNAVFGAEIVRVGAQGALFFDPADDDAFVGDLRAIDEAVNRPDVSGVVDTSGLELSLEDIRGFPRERAERRRRSVS